MNPAATALVGPWWGGINQSIDRSWRRAGGQRLLRWRLGHERVLQQPHRGRAVRWVLLETGWWSNLTWSKASSEAWSLKGTDRFGQQGGGGGACNAELSSSPSLLPACLLGLSACRCRSSTQLGRSGMGADSGVLEPAREGGEAGRWRRACG
jgi:hypothetical protein